jgi:hypothetical protein
LRLAATGLEPDGVPGMRLTLSLDVAVANGDQAVPRRLASDADGQLHRSEATRNAVSAGMVRAGSRRHDAETRG